MLNSKADLRRCDLSGDLLRATRTQTALLNYLIEREKPEGIKKPN